MHAYPDLHAVTKPSPFPAVLAAMESPEYAHIKRLAASTGIEQRLAQGGEIPVGEIDKMLTAHHVGARERIQLKAVLSRLHLLKE